MKKALCVAAFLTSSQFVGAALANTGIVVSPAGHILTAYHVVRSCARVAVTGGVAAIQIALDKKHDLALLKMSPSKQGIALFRDSPVFGTGYRVTVAGFPLKDWPAATPKLTTGIVTTFGQTGLAAKTDDSSEFLRFTAPLVSGISGGPVLDNAGNLVAMAVAVMTVRGKTEGAPLSIKLGVGVARQRLLAFLDEHKVPYRKSRSDTALPDRRIAQKAHGFTLRVRCSR